MIGFIGGGNMAEALIKGIVQSSKLKVKSEIIVSELREERRQYLEQTYGVKTTSSNKEAASACDIIILAVKPQNMEQVLNEIKSAATKDKTVVSIAAGITLSYLQSRLNTKKLIRVMPNTPAIVQEGMSVMSLCGCFYGKEFEVVKSILMSVGKALVLPEEQMNAVTALSGSGPAFVALFTEALIEAGVKLGLNRSDAAQLAVQTVLGTARLLDTGMSAGNLRKMVTSPGGTTEAGLKVFEENNFMGIVADALKAAQVRAEELGRSG
ncbi:MAG: pyrroline-5-carboxylate reductase [Nitrospira bacterium HGW-Nitrospira-1]|nr:MAG: pyrroline-5-carboxylate reductase [Nitrospira bacterium HGW-Nitrospira-1]